jgi:DNA-3-methyladenine glycosylase
MVLVKDGVGGRIVETEAYHEDEPASHAFVGPTRRNASLFLAGGHLYVYRIHQVVCANVSCGPAGSGAGVLFRALAPTEGLDAIAARRAPAPRREWANGPGKLCRALAIGLEDDGQDLVGGAGPVRVVDVGERVPDERVVVGPRVGISKAVGLPWRFRVLHG